MHSCMESTTKTCKVCGLIKPTDEFYRASDQRYLQPDCKACHVEASRRYYHRLPPEAKARRIATIKARKYGMTLDEMLAYVEQHDDNCDICGQPDTTHRNATWTRQLTFDHDHDTGRLRGMLCSQCNLALGRFGEDVELLRKAIDYIERFR